MSLIVKGKPDHFGKPRSQQEKNLRKEWGPTMTDKQFSQLKFAEKKMKEETGSKKNFIRGQDIDRVK